MKIKIQFDNPTKIYHVGETVSGTVVVHVHKSRMVKNITLKLTGYSYCSWTEDKMRRREGKFEYFSELHTGTQSHLSHKEILAGNEDGTNRFELKPDVTYNYSFQYTLPLDLPSSVKGDYGFTVYAVKAKVKSPLKKTDSKVTSFTVISSLDLNKVHQAKQTFFIQLEKYNGMWCWKSGPFRATIWAPQSGFVEGEVAAFTIEAENRTNNYVKKVNVKIMQTIKYSVTSPYHRSRKCKQLMKDMNFGGLSPREYRVINADLQMPLMIPSSNDCIVEVYYKVVVEFRFSGLHTMLKGCDYIFIGTVPLKEKRRATIIVPPPTENVPEDSPRKVKFLSKLMVHSDVFKNEYSFSRPESEESSATQDVSERDIL